MVELASILLPAPLRFNFTELQWSDVPIEPNFFAVNVSSTAIPSPFGQPRTFFGLDAVPVTNTRKRTTDAVHEPVYHMPAVRKRLADAAARKRKIDPTDGVNKVLIINAYTTDHAPGSAKWTLAGGAATASDERTRQVDTFNVLVKAMFNQMSYNNIEFAFTGTAFVALPNDDDYYFWRQADIDAAQAAYDSSMTAANKNALDNAIAWQAITQRAGDLFYDAVTAAKAAGVAVDTFDGIYVNVMAPFLRCAAHGTGSAAVEDRPSAKAVSVKSDTYFWHCSIRAHWARRVHEIAHSFFSGDLYGSAGVISSGSAFDIMGSHNSQQRGTGYNLVDKVGWYAPENVKKLTVANYPLDQTYRIRAHGASQDSTSNDIYHVVKIEVHENLAYYIEVRQAPRSDAAPLRTTSDSPDVLKPATTFVAGNASHQVYDTYIDNNNALVEHRSGVLVTKVDMATAEDLNQADRFITVLGPERLLRVGEAVDDPANNLRVEVQALETATTGAAAFPARYRVRVRWTSAVADPSGLFNLRIRQWDSNYQTNDIWFDSPSNGYDSYSSGIEAPTGNALGNGDKPRVGKDNRYHAHVWNDGLVDATNLQITYYLVSPPGVGDNGKWIPLWTRYLTGIAAGNHSRATPVATDAPLWRPVAGEHTCAKVAISKIEGETTIADNEAQENIFTFDSGGGSPHEAILFETMFRNPQNLTALIHARAENVPRGWEVTFEHSWVVLPPLGERSVRVTILNDVGRSEAPYVAGPITTHPTASTIGSCCERQFGGSLVANIATWKCTDDPAGTQFSQCVARGGLYHRHKKCSDVPCGRSIYTDGIACCTPNGCLSVPSTDRCAAVGGSPLPLGSTCAADGNRLCSGACCFTNQQSVKLGSTSILTDPVLTCSDLDRGTCKSLGGHLSIDRSCKDPNFQCVPDEVKLVLGGVVRSWERPHSVIYNRESAEHYASIGGVLMAVRAKTRGFCTYVPPTPNSPNAHYCIFDPSVRPIANVRVQVTMGQCAPRFLVTDSRGCIDLDVAAIGGDEPWDLSACWSSNSKTLLVEGEIVDQKLVATGDCPPVLLSCTSFSSPTFVGVRVRCPDRIDVGSERCEFDKAAKRCTRATCPLTGSPCVRAQALNGATICRCQEPVERCFWDAERKECSRPDCPNDPTLACLLDPASPATQPRCLCGKPEVRRCEFDAQRGRCSRPDCHLDPTRRCVMSGVDNTGKPLCLCEQSSGTGAEQCEWDECKKSCRTPFCPSNRKLPCVPFRHDNGTMYCAGCKSLVNPLTSANVAGFAPITRHAVVEIGSPTCVQTGGGDGAVNVLLTAAAPLVDDDGMIRILLDLLANVRRFSPWWMDVSVALRTEAQPRLSAEAQLKLHIFAFEHWWFKVAGHSASPAIPTASWWPMGSLEPAESFVLWWRRASGQNSAPPTERRLQVQLGRGDRCDTDTKEALAIDPGALEPSRPKIADPKDENAPQSSTTCCQLPTGKVVCIDDERKLSFVLVLPVDHPGVMVCDSGGQVRQTPLRVELTLQDDEKAGAVIPRLPDEALTPTPRPTIATPGPTTQVDLDNILPDYLRACFVVDPRRTTTLQEGVETKITETKRTETERTADTADTNSPAPVSATEARFGGLNLSDTLEALLVAALAICALCCVILFVMVLICANQRRHLKKQHQHDVEEARRMTELATLPRTSSQTSGRRRRTSSRQNQPAQVIADGSN
jgi:hypothetical protein